MLNGINTVSPQEIRESNDKAESSIGLAQEAYAFSLEGALGNYIAHGNVEMLVATYKSIVKSYGNGQRAKSAIHVITSTTVLNFNEKAGEFRAPKKKKDGRENNYQLVQEMTANWWLHNPEKKSQDQKEKTMAELFTSFRNSVEKKADAGLVSDYDPQIMERLAAFLNKEVAESVLRTEQNIDMVTQAIGG